MMPMFGRMKSRFALTLVLGALTLTACVRTPEPLPNLSLDTLSNWWATTPEAELSTFSTLRMQFTLENTGGVALEFLGDGGGSDPADELQIWTVPNVLDPAVTFTSFPEGSYDPGQEMSWDITIDLSTVGAGETGIAIRPVANPIGTVGPDSAALVSATLTLHR